jgi:hypothetical protein
MTCRGEQPGAPGAYLAWRQVPDTTQDLFPQGSCACGADLAAAADLGVRHSHQVMDVPQARAETTWYDRHEVTSSPERRRPVRIRVRLLPGDSVSDNAPRPPQAGPRRDTAHHLGGRQSARYPRAGPG